MKPIARTRSTPGAREKDTALKYEEQMAAVRAVECAIMAHDEYEKAECEGADSKVDEGGGLV